MGQGYQDRDFAIIDYELYTLEGFSRPLRGPRPATLAKDQFFVALGAAQTFGCYCHSPYPLLLQQALKLPVLNFGVAGAGPGFFLSRPAFIEKANEARFAIIQVMSGRSESNSLFESKGGEMLTRRHDGVSKGAAPMYQELLASEGRQRTRAIVEETRENWLANMEALLEAIKIPKILLWMSTRKPAYRENYRSVDGIFGAFPQLIDDALMKRLEGRADVYVESVCSDGLPQPLINRFTGDAGSITMRQDLGGNEKLVNNYYPSPQMHLAAAEALYAPALKLGAACAQA